MKQNDSIETRSKKNNDKVLNLAIILLTVVLIAAAAAFAVVIYPYVESSLSYKKLTQSVITTEFDAEADKLLSEEADPDSSQISATDKSEKPDQNPGSNPVFDAMLSAGSSNLEKAGSAGGAADGSAAAGSRWINFDALKAVNADCIAWIYGCGGKINYPVPVTGDREEDYYLKHGADGRPLKAGSIFVGKGIAKPFDQFETILYGHNMRNGSMFHSLMSYKNRSYFTKNPRFLIAREDRTDIYDIFAVVITDNDTLPFCIRYTEEEEEKYLKDIMNASIYSCGVPVNTADEIVTLVTCEYSGANYRLAVYGKRQKT